MAETDKKKVVDLKVSITSEPSTFTSAAGKNFTKFKAVHEKDDGEQVWIQVLAPGSLGESVAPHVVKGRKVKVSGGLKVTENLSPKDGKMYKNTAIFANSFKVVVGGKLVEIDEFSMPEPKAESEETPF
jgi:single-stranded DNA-binding protein